MNTLSLLAVQLFIPFMLQLFRVVGAVACYWLTRFFNHNRLSCHPHCSRSGYWCACMQILPRIVIAPACHARNTVAHRLPAIWSPTVIVSPTQSTCIAHPIPIAICLNSIHPLLCSSTCSLARLAAFPWLYLCLCLCLCSVMQHGFMIRCA